MSLSKSDVVQLWWLIKLLTVKHTHENIHIKIITKIMLLSTRFIIANNRNSSGTQRNADKKN